MPQRPVCHACLTAAVARETNCSDTGFVIREQPPDADFRLRWFTPKVEVDLCGHATLASAHCLFEDGVTGPIRFATRSGVLTVSKRSDGSLAMDFPAWPPAELDARNQAAEALGTIVEWTGRTDNGFFLLALLADERSVRDLRPDLAKVGGLDATAVIVTAVADPGRPYDFVSRLFAPNAGIPEDPVTGSSHTVLAPFWADSDRFGGSVTIPAGSSAVEPGVAPARDVTLSWNTFSDAADQAGISRRYGGIHFEQGDLDARITGPLAARRAWAKAQSYFTGTAVT